MANVERRANVIWEGDLFGGNGSLSEGSGVLNDSPVTFAARTQQPEGKTSPEELIASAHATCYAMALSNTLAEGGNAPEQLEVEAACVLDDEALKITTMDLTVRGTVPGLGGQEDFENAAQQAEDLCPVSNALRGNVEIRLHATLEG
jgi:osmotically inducible protein OsmC